jgi:hypothetical protein
MISSYRCYACESDVTYLHPTDGHACWMLNPPTDLVLCNKCKFRYIFNHQSRKEEKNAWARKNYSRRYPHWKETVLSRRLTYKGKYLFAHEKVRNNQCIKCGKIGYTHLHHVIYHDDNPLKDTMELCASCHAVETWKTRRVMT